MNFFSWKQFFLSPLCIGCGSFFCDDSLFCVSCYQKYVEKKVVCDLLRIENGGQQHLYLLDWHKSESDVVSQMVYRLKSNNSAQALKFYGKILAAALSHSTDTTEFAGVIPIPSSKKTSVHALILAEEIATATGLPLLNVLEKTEAPEQKTLSKTERRAGTSIHLKPNLNEEFTSDHVHPLKYVFVDDILTTGESFKQSCHILAGHQDNLAVTLFFRSKSE